MSRISRYQDSMNRFIKNKSCITKLDGNIRLLINKVMNNTDNIVSIILLTILGSQSKKNGYSLHGYYMGCGIEMMMIIAKITDNKQIYIKKYSNMSVNKIINRLSTLTNICLSQNIEYIQNILSEKKALKIYFNMNRLLNNILYDIMDDDYIEYSQNIKKTDLLKFTFERIKSPKTMIAHIKQANRDHLLKFIQNKYGSICKLAIIMGWILGGSDEKNMHNLERLGDYLGVLIKISYDFENLERDLENSKDLSNNYIINFGIQNGFELFIENKLKFVEGCMMLDIYTNTIKEILDLIENKVDIFINNTIPDLKSQYTISINSKN